MSQIHLTDPDSEECLIGSCIESSTALMTTISSGLSPEDFNAPACEIIYRTMRDMMERGELIDAITLTARLDSSGKLELIGGKSVIERIAGSSYITHHASEYASVVKDRSIRRSLFDATQNIADEIHTCDNVRDLLGSAENMVYRVSDKLRTGSSTGIKAEDLIQLYTQRKRGVEKIAYSLPTLNKLTRGGRQRGKLTLYGGYSSDGKSVMGLQSALDGAKAGYSTAIFSLEMNEEELLYRLLSMETGLPVEYGVKNLDDQKIIDDAAKRLSALDLVTYHDPDLTPTEIRSIQMRNKYDLVVVDYLQRFYFKEWRDLVEYAKKFKNMALSTHCCVDLLTQLQPQNVAYGGNPYTVPNLNSPFGGKAISHEADNVVFVYANRLQSEDGKWLRTNGGELILAKQRGGKGEGSFPIRFYENRVMWLEESSDVMLKLPSKDIG